MTEQELKVKIEYAFSHEFNHTLHAYIDITNDLIAGTLLSQILYWFSSTKDGKRKVKIFKDGYFWLAKKREDWNAEIRISAKQYDRAISLLTANEFVITKKYKFDGSPTTHLRPNYENINKALNEWRNEKAKQIIAENPQNQDLPNGENDFDQSGNWNLPFGQIQDLPNGENDFDQSGKTLTEITSEPIPEVTSVNIKSEFETLWKMYPKKLGKTKALQAYQKARKKDTTFEQVEQGINAYNQYIKNNNIKTEYIKHGSTWFNGSCWLDEYEQAKQPQEPIRYGGTYL